MFKPDKRKQDFVETIKKRINAFLTVKWKYTCRYIGLNWKAHHPEGVLILKILLFDISELLIVLNTGSSERSAPVSWGNLPCRSQQFPRENGINLTSSLRKYFSGFISPLDNAASAKYAFAAGLQFLQDLESPGQELECKRNQRTMQVLSTEQVSANPQESAVLERSINIQ